MEYRGAKPWAALKTNGKSLKTILDLTGSQWREWRTGVMWLYHEDPAKRLAAEFWTSWFGDVTSSDVIFLLTLTQMLMPYKTGCVKGASVTILLMYQISLKHTQCSLTYQTVFPILLQSLLPTLSLLLSSFPPSLRTGVVPLSLKWLLYWWPFLKTVSKQCLSSIKSCLGSPPSNNSK